MPPDFFLSKSDETDLLEVKTFNYAESPNFDVANFDAYVRDLREKSFRLDADYLIIGYSLSKGVIKINNIWLKKIWEITCPSTEFALRTQVKQGKIYNIRPYNFKSEPNGFQPFKERLSFVRAIRETLVKYTKNKLESDEWFESVLKSYKKFSGASL